MSDKLHIGKTKRQIIQDTETYHILGWHESNDRRISLCGRIIISNGYQVECNSCEKIYDKRNLDGDDI